MKKKILIILTIAVVIISSMGGLTAFAAVSMEECDRCFQTTMNALLTDDEVNGHSIAAVRKPVYDIKLEQLGFVYEFDIAKGSGYAIIICDDGNYAAVEVLPNAQSPYAEVSEDEQCVFANTMSYYKAVDEKICDIATDEEIPEEVVEVLEQNAILYTNSDIVTPEYVDVVVEYQGEPDEDFYKMSYRTPEYCGPGLVGGCAAVAGGNLIGYFDRYYEDLIPNHTAGYYRSDIYYCYNYADDYVYEAINTLYADMNGNGNGITESDFKNGLQVYCSRKGLSCDFTSLKSWGSLNYSAVKSSMKAGKPVALLLNTYNTCEIGFGTNKDYLHYSNYSGNHVMVGFGYRDTTYTLTNGSKSNYRFIYVATGFGDPSDGYFNIDYNTNIVSAYGVNIH